MVTDTKALRAINDAPDGILGALEPGKIYVDSGTYVNIVKAVRAASQLGGSVEVSMYIR